MVQCEECGVFSEDKTRECVHCGEEFPQHEGTDHGVGPDDAQELDENGDAEGVEPNKQP